MFDKIINDYINSLKSPGELETLLADAARVRRKIEVQDAMINEMTNAVENENTALEKGRKLTGKWAWKPENIENREKKIATLQTRIDSITRQKSFVQDRDELELEQKEIAILLQRIEVTGDGLENGKALVVALEAKRDENTKRLAAIRAERHDSVMTKLGSFYGEGSQDGSPEAAIGLVQLHLLALERPGGSSDESAIREALLAARALLEGARETLAQAKLEEAAAAIIGQLDDMLSRVDPMRGGKAEVDGTVQPEAARLCGAARDLVEGERLQRSRSQQDKTAARDVVGSALGALDQSATGQAARAVLERAGDGAASVTEVEDRIDTLLSPFDKVDRLKPEAREQALAEMKADERETYLSLKEAKRKLAASANDVVQGYFLITQPGELRKGAVEQDGVADGAFLAATNSASGDYNDPKNLGKYTYHLTALGNLIRNDSGIIRKGLAPQHGGTAGGSSEIAGGPKFMKQSIQEASFINSEDKVAVSSNRDEGTKVYIKQREDRVDELMKDDERAEAARATSIMLRFPIRAEYLGKFGKDPIHLKNNLELLDGTPVPPADIQVLVHRQWVSILDEAFQKTYSAAMTTKE